MKLHLRSNRCGSRGDEARFDAERGLRSAQCNQSLVTSPASSSRDTQYAIRNTFHATRNTQHAFTLIEIAICLAVIGFALVAIIGILPFGMQVQKDNRQETLINQDASIFLEAIRGGSRLLDDLTNYVLAVTNYYSAFPPLEEGATRTNSGLDAGLYPPLDSGNRIVGILSRPKWAGPHGTNQIVAFVRCISGPASEKFPQRDDDVSSSFMYRLNVDLLPYSDFEPLNTNNPVAQVASANLWELRLTFRWPLDPHGIWKGGSKQVFRTLVGGRLYRTNDGTAFFLDSTTYTNPPPGTAGT